MEIFYNKYSNKLILDRQIHIALVFESCLLYLLIVEIYLLIKVIIERAIKFTCLFLNDIIFVQHQQHFLYLIV
jgi:hypothetical protein